MIQNNITASDFDQMHIAVHKIFEKAAKTIEAKIPSVKGILGRTTTDRFPMYSHVTFEDVSRREIDPLVVGVDVRIDSGKFLIQAHIIGEESGEAYLDLPNLEQPFGTSLPELLNVIARISQELADNAEPVLRRVFIRAQPGYEQTSQPVGGEAALK